MNNNVTTLTVETPEDRLKGMVDNLNAHLDRVALPHKDIFKVSTTDRTEGVDFKYIMDSITYPRPEGLESEEYECGYDYSLEEIRAYTKVLDDAWNNLVKHTRQLVDHLNNNGKDRSISDRLCDEFMERAYSLLTGDDVRTKLYLINDDYFLTRVELFHEMLEDLILGFTARFGDGETRIEHNILVDCISIQLAERHLMEVFWRYLNSVLMRQP